MGRYSLLAVALAACYDPTAPQGVVCTVPDGLCPAGQMCSADGTCVKTGSMLPVDARAVDGSFAPSDGPGSDASSSALPAWRLVQVQSADNGGAGGLTSLAATLMPTTVGDLLVVGVQFAVGTTIASVSDNAEGGTSTFSAIPGSHARNAHADGNVAIWYTPSANAGATAVTATAGTASVYTVVVWEFATAQAATVDIASGLSDQASSTTPVAPALTTMNAGELVVAIGIVATSISQLQPGNEFTNDTLANANGWAHITSATAPAGAHQAAWDSTAGTYCSSAVAFHVGE
jgi:predicted RecA/RadA family phage recombinase